MTALDDEIQTLQARVAELEAHEAGRERAEKVQDALYRIAETASAAEDMQDFYRKIHAIVGELMYADNLYIALYDDDRRMINFPYFVDTVDLDQPDPNVWEPFGIGNAAGTTAYLLRVGTPLLLSDADWRRMAARGEIELVGEEAESWVGVPLQSEGKTIGAIVVQSYLEDKAHTQADMELLEFVGHHIASALERTRLIDDTRQRNAELALINDVQRGLAMKLDMQAMYDLVGDRLQEIFDAQVVDIAVLDEAAGLVRFPYTIEKGVRFHDEPMAIFGFRKRVLETREPLLFGVITPEILAEFDQPSVISGEPAKSSVFVPLVVAGRATGVISLQNVDREHAFNDADLRLLTTLAGSLSVALENARLFEETRQRNAELALINDVQRGLAENLEMQAMYDLVGDRIQEIFDAQVVDIEILDVDAERIHFAYEIERGIRFHNEPIEIYGFRKAALETREPVVVNSDMERRSAEVGNPLISGEAALSAIFVPLLVGDQATGLITLQNNDREHAFSEADVRLLTTLAGSLSVALENARLFEETKQRNAELALINDVQRGLAENLEMQAMYDLVGDRLQAIFDAQVVNITVVNETNDQVSFPYIIEKGERLAAEPMMPVGFRKHVLETREPLLFDAITEELLAEYGQPEVLVGERPKSSVWVPLIVSGRATGVITLQNLERERAFSEVDLRLLTTLAGSLSVALENARLFEETRQRNAELAVINDVQRGLAENLDMQAMYDLVGDRLVAIFDAQVLDIGVLDRDSGMITWPYSIERGVRYFVDPQPPSAPSRHVMDSREALLLDERVEERIAELGGTRMWGSEQMPATMLLVPLVIGGEAIGRITLQNLDREHAFSEADVRLLTTLAGSLSVALENARLFEETRQRNAELALINDVQRGLAENLEMQAMYDLVGDRIREIFDAQTVDIGVVDEDAGTIWFPYSIERGERLIDHPIEIMGFRKIALQTREPVVINEDMERRCIEAGNPLAIAGEPSRSSLFVPLLIGSRGTGVISLHNLDREHAFSEADVRLLTTLAGSLSVGLENARLFEETGQRAAELAIVNNVGQALAEQLDLDALIEALGDQLREVFVADLVYVALHDRSTDMIEFAYYNEKGERVPDRQLRFGEGLTSKILETREPMLLNRATAFEEVGVQAIGTPAKSYLGVPIVAGSEAIGVISVQSTEQAGRFGQDDARLLSTIAANVGVAIQNARLYAETGRRASEMAALAALGREIGALLDLEPILGEIGGRARELLDADTSAVFLEREGRFVPVVALGETAELILADTIVAGEGIIGDLAIRGTAEVVNDVLHDERGVQIPGAEEEEEERLMAAPLLARGEVIGMMAVWRSAPAPLFTDNDLDFLVGLSQQAAIAIENARLFQTSRDAEEGYRKQKQYFESLVEISPVAVVTMDRDQTVSGWNPAAARLFGYSPDEAIGRTIDSLIVPGDLAQEGDDIVREATERGRAHRMSRRHQRDGQLVEVEIDIVPLIVDGEHQGYYAIYHDITELQEARKTADAANESKSAFLATMSHEIRTPMNAIIGMSGLLAETELDAEQREYASTIARSGEALLTIINDILDFSKIEAGRMDLELAPFDVRECVEAVVDLIGPIAQRKGLEVTYGIEPGTPETAVGDTSRLRQILLNLLNNAVKFTDEGEIAVHVEQTDPPGQDRIAFHVAIRDTGVGIPSDRIDRLFQSFTQVDASTSRRFGGTGLGLAISRRLAELMGGTVTAESSGVPGEGSTFHVTFEAGTTDMTPTALRRDGSFAGRRALIVDDNATNLLLMTALLSAWGVETTTASSGEEGLAALEQGAFDVAILDMLMPGMDGLELATRLHEHVSELPTILASSVPRHDVASDPRWEGAGIGAVIVKPIKASALHGALAIVLDEAGAEEAPSEAVGVLDAELAERHPLRILIAEDNVVNQRLALRLLEKLGYRADVVANGLEAVEAVGRQEYDLVLMDVQMPDMDGVQATQRILERLADGERPWIVAMTAEVMRGDREGFLAAGMNDYVAKPIRPQELIAAITRTPSRRRDRVAADEDGARPSVDDAVLERLAESMGGDDAFVAELIDQFVTDSPALVAAARRGLEARDADEVRRAAHTLKSNAATFGANELADRSSRLEAAAKGGSLEDGPAQLEAIEDELGRVHAALRASTS